MVRRPLPDELDTRILAELEKDARISYRELGRRLGVSTPTVSYRIRRMEEAGLIRGYRVVAAIHEPTKPVEHAPPRMQCAHCRGPIHGPAAMGRFGGHAQAFCCGVCLEAFSRKFRQAPRDLKEGGATLMVLLGWVVSFGTLGAACLGAAPMCSMPGVVPLQPSGACWAWDRPRQSPGAWAPRALRLRPWASDGWRVSEIHPATRGPRAPAPEASNWRRSVGP